MRFSESLKKNRDFQTVYNKGKSLANSYLVMYVMDNGLEKNRLGISVSKKVGNSVVRHRRAFPKWDRYNSDSKGRRERKRIPSD